MCVARCSLDTIGEFLLIIHCTLCKKEIRLDPRIRNAHWYHKKCVMKVDLII